MNAKINFESNRIKNEAVRPVPRKSNSKLMEPTTNLLLVSSSQAYSISSFSFSKKINAYSCFLTIPNVYLCS